MRIVEYLNESVAHGKRKPSIDIDPSKFNPNKMTTTPSELSQLCIYSGFSEIPYSVCKPIENKELGRWEFVYLAKELSSKHGRNKKFFKYFPEQRTMVVVLTRSGDDSIVMDIEYDRAGTHVWFAQTFGFVDKNVFDLLDDSTYGSTIERLVKELSCIYDLTESVRHGAKIPGWERLPKPVEMSVEYLENLTMDEAAEFLRIVDYKVGKTEEIDDSIKKNLRSVYSCLTRGDIERFAMACHKKYESDGMSLPLFYWCKFPVSRTIVVVKNGDVNHTAAFVLEYKNLESHLYAASTYVASQVKTYGEDAIVMDKTNGGYYTTMDNLKEIL